jgi:hypothetical protein
LIEAVGPKWRQIRGSEERAALLIDEIVIEPRPHLIVPENFIHRLSNFIDFCEDYF